MLKTPYTELNTSRGRVQYIASSSTILQPLEYDGAILFVDSIKSFTANITTEAPRTTREFIKYFTVYCKRNKGPELRNEKVLHIIQNPGNSPNDVLYNFELDEPYLVKLDYEYWIGPSGGEFVLL